MFFSLQELTGVTQESFQSFSRGTISKMRRDGNNNKMSAAKRLLLVFVKIKLGLTIAALSKIVKLGKSVSLMIVICFLSLQSVALQSSLGLEVNQLKNNHIKEKFPY